jgi:hypothetical protein
MRSLWVILFIVAVQIIAGIAQKRKKDAERRAREEALARNTQMQAQGGPAGVGDPRASPPTPGSSQAELESRRKSQLEQLRQRRDGRRMGQPMPGQSPRSGVAIPTQPSSRPSIMSAPALGTSDQARTKAQQAERRAKEAERQRRDQQGRLAAQQQELEDAVAHKAYEAGFHAVADVRSELHPAAAARGGASQTKSTTVTQVTQATVGTPRLRPGAGLLQGLHDPKSLREVMILRELLDRPLSLRDDRN